MFIIYLLFIVHLLILFAFSLLLVYCKDCPLLHECVYLCPFTSHPHPLQSAPSRHHMSLYWLPMLAMMDGW